MGPFHQCESISPAPTPAARLHSRQAPNIHKYNALHPSEVHIVWIPVVPPAKCVSPAFVLHARVGRRRTAAATRP